MPSSGCTNHIDFENVNARSESFTDCTEDMEWMKCVYDLIFEAIEPTDDQKLKLLNNLIAKTTAADELRKYHMNRAYIFLNMRQWKNVFDDINYIEQYGPLDGKMSILKIKATIQYELEKARQTINETISSYMVDSYEERMNYQKRLMKLLNAPIQISDYQLRTI